MWDKRLHMSLVRTQRQHNEKASSVVEILNTTSGSRGLLSEGFPSRLPLLLIRRAQSAIKMPLTRANSVGTAQQLGPQMLTDSPNIGRKPTVI